MIYTQILIPNKKEKIYLWVLGIATIAMLGLCLLNGLVFFKDVPGIGVSISVTIVDFIAIIALIILTKEYSKAAIFNLNNLKIILVGIVIGVFTYFVGPILRSALVSNGLDIQLAMALELIIMILGCGVFYILSLFLLKENLIRGIFKNARN